MSDISLNKNTCAFKNCNKKIKLTDYPCKCEKYYCKFHRPPEIHNCIYDYKENCFKQNKIDNLICRSNKIEKIN